MTTKSTANDLRKTGISVIGDVRWGKHICCFYETKQDLLDALVPYFKTGLDNKEFCLWVVSSPLTVEDAKRALGRAVADLDRHLAEGSLEIRAHDEWYLQNGQCDPQEVLQSWRKKLNQALVAGYAGLRASGDGGWVQKADWTVFRDYERELDALVADQRKIVLCTYPLSTTPGDRAFDVAHIHHVAVARRQGSWTSLETPELKQAKAEVERLNQALQRIKGRTPKPLSILSYGVAGLSVAAALFLGRWMQSQYNFEPFVLFLCAMMFSAWFGGLNAGFLALALSLVAFHYYFLIPIYPLGVGHEIPRLFLAALTSLFVVLLSAAQRTKTESLRRARDVLDGTVQDLRRTNVALRAENAERKQAEDALRQSEERFRELAENIDEVFWLSDFKHATIFYVSPAYEKLWGRSCNSLYASPRSWIDAIHPKDRQRVVDVLSHPELQSAPDMVYRIIRPDGSTRWVHARGFPVHDENGAVARVAGIAADITESRESEDALRQSEFDLAEAQRVAQIGSWTLDFTTEALRWSEELFRIFDVEKTAFTGTHEHFMSTVVPEDRNRVLGVNAEASSSGKPFAMEYRIKTRSGQLKDIRELGFARKDSAGAVTGLFGTAQDITERKRAEKHLEEAHRQLKILSRRRLKIQEEERRHLARELHDEIGQELTAAKINLQATMEELDGAKFKRIHETVAILERLLGQVRKISIDLRPSMLDDLGLVPALRSLIDEQGRRASVAVRFAAKNMPENLDPEIQTTCFRVAQEAITNAVRHANATRIDIDLGRENGTLRLQVRDDGRGFDAESVQAQTVGLGLLGIKERATLAGGEAKINSSPNKGTIVELSLPLISRADTPTRRSK